MALKIAKGLDLPNSAITQTFGVLAVRGAGKSNLAAVMAEEMHAAQLPFVVIDPVGSWFGLRSSSDGKKPGLDIPIFGGRHGDLPLERTAGVLLADLVVDKRMTCVLDVSDFSEGDKTRFLFDFADRLYRRNTQPLHLFLEEADDYIPQNPQRDEARLLRAWQNIVRRGRARGLGMTMITQRSAVINKSVLTQIETLFVLRTTSPQDTKAVEAWVQYNGQAKDALASLSGLENGEAWVWSPSYLKRFERVKVRQRSTFDSGATPKNAKAAQPPARLADVDLGAIKTLMAETIERAKAEDPKALRARIAELEKQLGAAKKGAAPSPELVAENQALRQRWAALSGAARALWEVTRHGGGVRTVLTDDAKEALAQVEAAVLGTDPPPAAARKISLPGPGAISTVRAKLADAPKPSPAPNSLRSALPEGERAILIAAAQTVGGATREQLSILSGYKRSTRDAYIQRLRGRGYVEERGGLIHANDAGVFALGSDYEPLPTGAALLDHWIEKLPEGEAKVLRYVAGTYPHAAPREAISESTGFKRSTRDAYIQRLGTRRLVAADRDGVTLSPELV